MKTPKPTTLAGALEPLARRHGGQQVFNSFCVMAACALAHGTREPEYLEAIKPYDRAELAAFPEALAALVSDMEAHPFEDRLGPLYMEMLGTKGQQWNGEFHTPPAVCRLIARMTYAEGADLPPLGTITVCEPACGAGAMILALAEAMPKEQIRRLRVTAIDINATACHMTFINTTLWGIPCRVLHGDTLRMQFWHGWSNVHHLLPWLAGALRVPVQGEPPDVHEATSLARMLQAEQEKFKLEHLS